MEVTTQEKQKVLDHFSDERFAEILIDKIVRPMCERYEARLHACSRKGVQEKAMHLIEANAACVAFDEVLNEFTLLTKEANSNA